MAHQVTPGESIRGLQRGDRAWPLLGKEEDRGEADHRHPQNDDTIEPHGCTSGRGIPNDLVAPPPSC